MHVGPEDVRLNTFDRFPDLRSDLKKNFAQPFPDLGIRKRRMSDLLWISFDPPMISSYPLIFGSLKIFFQKFCTNVNKSHQFFGILVLSLPGNLKNYVMILENSFEEY